MAAGTEGRGYPGTRSSFGDTVCIYSCTQTRRSSRGGGGERDGGSWMNAHQSPNAGLKEAVTTRLSDLYLNLCSFTNSPLDVELTDNCPADIAASLYAHSTLQHIWKSTSAPASALGEEEEESTSQRGGRHLYPSARLKIDRMWIWRSGDLRSRHGILRPPKSHWFKFVSSGEKLIGEYGSLPAQFLQHASVRSCKTFNPHLSRAAGLPATWSWSHWAASRLENLCA